MLSLVQRMFRRALSLDALYEKIELIENKLAELEKISDERDSLWLFIEEMREIEKEAYLGLEDELSDVFIRSIKPQGDA